MYRYKLLLLEALVLASLFFTFLAVLLLLRIFPFSTSETYTPVGSSPLAYPVLAALQSYSPALAPAGWTAVLGVWVWRGKMKSDWLERGFDRDTFRCLLQMKGGPTRTAILRALSAPKDRLQLSRDLGLDWTTIDHHMRTLLRQGLVSEKAVYGKVKIYEITTRGNRALVALQDVEEMVARGRPGLAANP